MYKQGSISRWHATKDHLRAHHKLALIISWLAYITVNMKSASPISPNRVHRLQAINNRLEPVCR